MNHILIITVCALGITSAASILLAYGLALTMYKAKDKEEDLKCMLIEIYSGKKNINVPQSIRDLELFKFMLQINCTLRRYCDSITLKSDGVTKKHKINSEGEDV